METLYNAKKPQRQNFHLPVTAELYCNKIDPFLKRTVTRDEKWVTYNNVK